LQAVQPDLNIEILGVNRIDQAPYNSGMTAGRTLPWLQDTVQDAVWTNWNVIYRDFRILDSQNRLYAVYNLTDHDLTQATNRETLKQMLLQAAQSVDANHDGLPDDWQAHYLENLAAGPLDDPDGDGVNNFSEFAFGTNPADRKSALALRASISVVGSNQVLTVRFRRRAGSVLNYLIETSSDLKQWNTNAANLNLTQLPQTLFDGSGTAEVVYTLTSPAGSQSPGFLRVRATPRSRT
jgi:hypothetical protein